MDYSNLDRTRDLLQMFNRKDWGDKVSIVLPERKISRQEILCEIEGWRKAFLAEQVTRVAIYSQDAYPLISMLFGAWAAGVTTVLPANTSLEMLQEVEKTVSACAGDFPSDCHLKRVVGMASCAPIEGDLCRIEAAVELYTSGSTDRPVALKKTLEQLFCEVQSMQKSSHGLNKARSFQTLTYSTVPAQHIYGLLFWVLWPFSEGRPVFGKRVEYLEELDAKEREVSEILLITSPGHLRRIPDDLFLEHLPFIGVFSGGGPLSEKNILQTRRAFGMCPVEIFGSSEAGGIATRVRTIEGTQVQDSPWQTLPNMETRIAEDGRLVLKSPQLGHDEWFVTDDIVEDCGNRTFRLNGRSDNVLKVEGKRVSCTAIDALLKKTNLVAETKAFLMPDERHSFAILCVLTEQGKQELLQLGKKKLVERLKGSLLASLERVTLPKLWRFSDAIPVNAMGKKTSSASERLFDGTRPQFVTWSQEENRCTVLLSVPANAPCFEGHFPGFKLLPGVVQLQWAYEIAMATLYQGQERKSQFQGMKTIKFLSPIFPDSTLFVIVSKTQGGVSYLYQKTDQTCVAKGELLL